VTLRPEDLNPVKPEPLTPDDSLLATVRNNDRQDGHEQERAERVRSENTLPDNAPGERERASRVVSELASAEREMVRHADNTERGRMPEREEQTLTRTIQKER
jgi:hypothetical protein